MTRVYLIVCVILIFAFGGVSSSTIRQEQAKVNVANPKYIKDVVVFTGRKSRNDPYLTNMTGTTLMPYGNNVSLAVTLKWRSGGDFRIAVKACETVKLKWMKEFTQTFTNLSFDRCPFPPARYRYFNMELPPKNMPLPMADGDYYLMYELLLTATKETFLEIETLLHYDKNARRAKEGKGKKG